MNCCDAPALMDAFAGVTAIEVRVTWTPLQPLSATTRARGNTSIATRRSGDFISPPRHQTELRFSEMHGKSLGLAE